MYDFSSNEDGKIEHFFNCSTRAPILDGVIHFLKTKNDSLDFVPRFIEKYGMPVWDNAVYLEDDCKYLLVPFKNPSKKEIEGIWTFKIENNNYIHSFPVIKQKTIERDYWTFDYFTCDVLKKKPKSGLMFEDVMKTKAGLPEYKCIRSRVEVELNGRIVYGDWKTHCWNDTENFSLYGDDRNSMMSDFKLDDIRGAGGYIGGNGGGGGGVAQPIDVDPKNIDVIVKSPVVVERMKAIWNAILSSLDPQKGRREVGCYVYYDTVNKIYVMGDLKYGDYVTGGEGTHGSVLPGSAQPSHNGVDKGLIPVTWIHGHTPLSYLSPEVSRTVGPSPNDLQWSKDCNTAIIVLDYVGKSQSSNGGRMLIIGGHDKNDPQKEYIVKP